MANDLKPYENITRVFWIKIELKENQKSGRQALGDIKDVMGGERQLIYELQDIICFMIPYLKSIGIRIHWSWQLACWLKHKRSRNSFSLSAANTKDRDQ